MKTENRGLPQFAVKFISNSLALETSSLSFGTSHTMSDFGEGIER